MKKLIYYSPMIPYLGTIIVILFLFTNLKYNYNICAGNPKDKLAYTTSYVIQAISWIIILHIFYPEFYRHH